MDALKKAELEKKKAAEKLKQSATMDEPLPGAQTPAETDQEQPTQQASRSNPDITGAGLSLEPIEQRGEITDEFTIVDDKGRQADDDADLNISIDRMPADRADEDEFEQTGKQPIPGTSHTMSAALREELDEGRREGTFYGVELDGEESSSDMYEETLQGEPYVGKEPPQIYDETLPGVSAVELARDIGDENQPTPVAAQTIFAASASRRSSSGLKWTIIVTSLIIIAVIAIGVIVYQNEAITPVELPSPLVARGIEDIVPAQQTVQAVPPGSVAGTFKQPETPAQAVTQQAGALPAVPAPANTPAPVPEQEAAALIAQVPPETTAPAAQTGGTAPGSGTTSPAEKSGGAAMPVAAASQETSPLQQLPPEIELTHALFKISKSKGPDKSAAIVKQAYAAYRSGDYAAAKTQYEKVIKDFPDSKDGLLGLGAIAMYEHDWNRAFAMYAHLLKVDPRNAVAKAALINLVGASGDENRESAIKLMLNDNPKSSYLYFSLGNVYASQLRWADAQQAYFDAYRYDSSNPNYALNLAIALDRMGQVETALDYYNTAIKLASGKQAEFDEAKVQARIETISANIN